MLYVWLYYCAMCFATHIHYCQIYLFYVGMLLLQWHLWAYILFVTYNLLLGGTIQLLFVVTLVIVIFSLSPS